MKNINVLFERDYTILFQHNITKKACIILSSMNKCCPFLPKSSANEIEKYEKLQSYRKVKLNSADIFVALQLSQAIVPIYFPSITERMPIIQTNV